MCCRAVGLVTLWDCGSAFGDAQLEDPTEVTSDENSAAMTFGHSFSRLCVRSSKATGCRVVSIWFHATGGVGV